MRMDFLRALGFLTILPVPGQDGSPQDLRGSAGWFPLAGAVLGGLLAMADRVLAGIFPPLCASALTVALWAFLTGGLHLDGLADTFDGLGGGCDRASRLETMKDSRLGTFGGAAVALVLLLKTAALEGTGSGGPGAVFSAAVLARWGMLFALGFFPPARPGGMGDTFRKHCGTAQLLLGTLTAVPAALLFQGWSALLSVLLVPPAVLLAGKRLSALLGGLTGDSYGAICEGMELLVLLAYAALG